MKNLTPYGVAFLLTEAIDGGAVLQQEQELKRAPFSLVGKPEGFELQFVNGQTFRVMVVEQ